MSGFTVVAGNLLFGDYLAQQRTTIEGDLHHGTRRVAPQPRNRIGIPFRRSDDVKTAVASGRAVCWRNLLDHQRRGASARQKICRCRSEETATYNDDLRSRGEVG
jgi:hypothetical protein